MPVSQGLHRKTPAPGQDMALDATLMDIQVRGQAAHDQGLLGTPGGAGLLHCMVRGGHPHPGERSGIRNIFIRSRSLY